MITKKNVCFAYERQGQGQFNSDKKDSSTGLVFAHPQRLIGVRELQRTAL